MAEYIKRIKTKTGDMQIDYTALGNLPVSDKTLTQDGNFADAKAVGDELKKKANQTEVTTLKEDLTKLTNFQKWNLAENCEFLDELMVNNATQIVGNTISTAYFPDGYTVKVPVEKETIIYFLCERYKMDYGSTGYNNKYSARFLCFADYESKFIEGYSYPKTMYAQSHLVPVAAKWAYITFVKLKNGLNGEYWVTTKAENEHFDDIDLADNVQSKKDIYAIKKQVENIQKNNSRSIQKIRKPTFSFIFDDGTSGDEKVKVLFDSYKFKCGFALVANNDLANIKSKYLTYQNEGYEILSHSVNGNAWDGIDSATADNYAKESLKILRANGFVVDGFVTPSTWTTDAGMNAIKKYYQYGFGHLAGNPEGNHSHIFYGLDIRQLDRCSLESNTVDTILSKINENIANNGYMIFYGHSYPTTINNMTEQNMKRILDYLKMKVDNNEIVIDVPRDAINDYYSPRHSDLLEMLKKSQLNNLR